MDKKTRKTLQSSLESIDTSVLVLEAVARLKEQFTDSDSHLTNLANELCNAKELLSELVEFHHGMIHL